MMNLEGFIDALDRAGADMDVENLLDVFWIASTGRALSLYGQSTSEETVHTGQRTDFVPGTLPHGTRPPKPNATHSDATASIPGTGSRQRPAAAPAATSSVYARGSPSAGDRTKEASPFRVPAGRALAHRLPLTRALRPLSQRWQSRQFEELDEARTVDATARLREVLPDHVNPVFRPMRERWFDVELVHEDDSAIEVWADTLREFAQMLRETGAFRQVRSWRLRVAKPGMNPARDQLENAAGSRVASVHLSGSGVRRLIIFATHGSSSCWLDGRYVRVLEPWVRDGSLLLLQLMPPERWAQTRLGEPHGFAHAPKAGSTAASLEVSTQWWKVAFEPGTKGLLPVPTAPLDDRALGAWARMQMARGRQCPAYLLDPSANPARESDTPMQLESQRDFERAAAQLRQVSPSAFHLAVSLCNSVFTLPVARLVLSASQGQSGDQSVLAELLQSGLVMTRQDKGGDVRTFGSTQYYEFRPLAREMLLRSQRKSDAEQLACEIRAQVSQYLRQISGSPVSTSQFIPDKRGSYDLPAWAQPFAEVATSLLGGPKDPQAPQKVFAALEGDSGNSEWQLQLSSGHDRVGEVLVALSDGSARLASTRPAALTGPVLTDTSPGATRDGILISFRRGDELSLGGRLYERLSKHFGSERVFSNLASIGTGHWRDKVEGALARSAICVVVIGKRWANVDNLLRLHNPADMLRQELMTVLADPEMMMVPTLVEGAKQPTLAELPPELHALFDVYPRTISDMSWGEDVRSLINEVAAATNPAALLNRKVRRGGHGRDDGAIAQYTALIEMPGAPIDRVVSALVNRGVSKGQVGDINGAIADYTTAIELPGAPASLVDLALFNRGVMKGRRGDIDGAIADYTAAIELLGAPTDHVTNALISRGIARGQRGDNDGEIADYTAAIEVPGASADHVARALLNRGIAKGQRGDRDGRIADYTAAIEVPGASADHVARALLNRGISKGQRGDSDGAIDDYTAAIELIGAPAEYVTNALISRGIARGLRGDNEGEIADYTAAIEMREASPDQVSKALLNRGIAKGQRGDRDGRIADYTAAIEVHGASADQVARALLNRGIAKGQRGDSEGAIADYTAVLALPDAPVSAVELARRTISKLVEKGE